MKLDSHKTDQLLENARFVMESAGLTIETAARRLGVTSDALEKAFQREAKEKADVRQ